ncbi:MAG: diaminobutyrate acetyltransferase, partial [Bacteroidetes bacterium]|nr:diaminobutyrate acetyltransferase [Bacteroidota bacterium]
ELRKPKKEDAKKIVNLIKIGGTLDLNSEYLYLLQTTHFQESCCVAVYKDEIVGFVSGYMIPQKNEQLFIWQVAVAKALRGQNLAMRMIMYIVDKLNVNYIISTVSPSNHSSIRVFQKIAQSLNAKLTNEVLFEISDFNDAHEEEVQYTIGPFTKKQ